MGSLHAGAVKQSIHVRLAKSLGSISSSGDSDFSALASFDPKAELDSSYNVNRKMPYFHLQNIEDRIQKSLVHNNPHF